MIKGVVGNLKQALLFSEVREAAKAKISEKIDVHAPMCLTARVL